MNRVFKKPAKTLFVIVACATTCLCAGFSGAFAQTSPAGAVAAQTPADPAAGPTASPTADAVPMLPEVTEKKEEKAGREKYTYIHNDGEYSVDLPDAPTATTIWADGGAVPYLDNTPRYGSIGEYATLRRVDPATGDYFDVQITFLRSTHDYLSKLTKDKVLAFLQSDFKDTHLDKEKIGYMESKSTMKWATISGFSVDKDNRLLYHASHFLTGIDTIEVITVTYTVENNEFNEDYKMLNASIKYAGR